VPRPPGDTWLRALARPVLRPLVGRAQAWQRRNLTDRERWERALHTELGFWDRVLGDRAAVERRDSLRPDHAWSEDPLYARIAELLPEGNVRVLDVGAGPATVVPKLHPGRTFHITALDPLADEYDALLDAHGIEPPVRTRRGSGEDLLDVVEPGSFDLAHAVNSVDHAYDPGLVVRNMLLAVKPGGLVLLRHERNEAVNEHYRGLHQWNFDASDDGRDLVVWRPGTRRNLSRELAGLGSGEVTLEGGWIVWLIRRSGAAS
jgi:SAM-dependent methyltransferase